MSLLAYLCHTLGSHTHLHKHCSLFCFTLYMESQPHAAIGVRERLNDISETFFNQRLKLTSQYNLMP